jgi:hypothetical protein
MSTDTRLYLNPKWELRDIITILERTQDKPVKVKVFGEEDTHLVGMFYLYVGERQITVFTNADTPIGTMTYLSLGANAEAVKIFKDIAEVLGGLLQPEDYKENFEMIQSKLNNDDAMPYFIKYAILHDGVEPNDLKGVLASMKKWFSEVSKSDSDIINQQMKELGI